MYTFGIYTNLQKDSQLKFTKRVEEALRKHSVAYYYDEELAARLGSDNVCGARQIDILIVLGGDGTMLTAARKYGPRGTTLFGLNMGRLGFLLDTELINLDAAIDGILKGNFRVENRLMLKAAVVGAGGHEKASSYALNEAVISQKNMLRLINVAVELNGLPVDNWHCDGLMVATPTGSTGYSLSAGGPIVFPTLDVMLITPVCPHTLQSSHIVINGSDEVLLRARCENSTIVLILDGQTTFDLADDDMVLIKKADFYVRFVKFTDKNFFVLLKEKLAEWVIKE